MSAVCSSGDGSSAPPLFAKNYVGGGVREARDVLALYSLLFGGQTDQQQLSIPEKKAAVNKELFAQVLLLLERSHRLSQRNNKEEEEDGFVLVTAHSGIEGAGTGVFLHKANHNSRGESEEKKVLRRGQLCCFYAGVVYSPVDMIAVYPHIYIDNHYLITRHDEVLIDGRATGISKTVFQNLWSRERRPTPQMKKEETREQADKKEESLDFVTLFRNPWAVAQLVNHPPAGKRPNVMCYALDWYLQEQEEQVDETEAMPMIPLHLQPHLPCLPFRQVRDERNGKQVLKGMVLVATRDIEEGEELFLDYHLNPKSENLPQWYHPVMPTTPNEGQEEEEEAKEESQPHNAATTITKGRDA